MLWMFFFFFNDTATTEIYTLSLHDALPISHQVVAQVAHGAAREARQARHRCGRQCAQALGQVADRVLGLARALPSRGLGPALDGAAAGPVAPHFARLGAEEGIAGPALAAHDRFEEEPEWRPGDLHGCPQPACAVPHH